MLDNGIIFDARIAEKYSIEEAIVIHKIYGWIKHNAVNGKNYHDGRYWTFNSLSAFAKYFPFWSESKVKRILIDLYGGSDKKEIEPKHEQLLLKGNFNKSSFDRTVWYSFTDDFFNFLSSLGYTLCSDIPQEETPFSESDQMDIPLSETPFSESDQMDIPKADKQYQHNNSNNNSNKNKKDKSFLQKKSETAQDIVDFYNEHTDANDFPRTKKASTKIQSAINARIKAGYTMQDIKTAILLMPTLSDWYKGKNDRCWKADLLWLLNDTKGNFARILDGGLHQSPVQKHQYDIIMASNGEINPNKYHPICDGYFIKYDPNLKGYLLVGRHPQKFNVPDGYTEITRPDGAILYSQYGRFKWNAFTRKWDESFVIF